MVLAGGKEKMGRGSRGWARKGMSQMRGGVDDHERLKGRCSGHKKRKVSCGRGEQTEAWDLRDLNHYPKVEYFHEFRRFLNIICKFSITSGF